MDTSGELASASVSDVYYTWTCPNSPVRVHMALGAIELIGRRVRSGFESVPSRPVEVGGLLLGTASSPCYTITIQEFEPLKSEERPDRRFVVSDSDRSKLKLALFERRPDRNGSLQVIGYYRSHIGEGLKVSEEDRALAYGCFRNPRRSVFLLVKRSPGGTLKAGFFLWNNGHFETESPFLEFPFEADQLAEDMPEEPPPKIENRPARYFLSLCRWWPGRMATWRLAVGAFVALLCLMWGIWEVRSVPVQAGLALRTERLENKFRVSWDRNAPMVRNAREALLSIRDGDAPLRELHLDADQLRNGGLLYSPFSGRVQFQLEVTATDQTRTSEIVVALGSPKKSTPASRPSQPAKGMKSSSVPTVGQATAGAEVSALMHRSSRADANRLAKGSSARSRKMVIPPPASGTVSDDQPNAAQLLEGSREASPTVAAEPAYVAAHPIRQLWPNLRPEIRRTVTGDAEIQVRVLIDQSGQVVRANAVSFTGQVSDSLASATLNAARLWTFVPATRDGQPVMSQMVLTFRYRPER